MIIKREDLYNILRAQLKGEYSIGFHGIDICRLKYFNLEKSEDNNNMAHLAAEEIRANGLKVFNSRTINGTVEFYGRIDDAKNVEHLKDGLSRYCYGGREIIIVAVPTIIRNKEGEEIFLGATNLKSKYEKYFDSTGYQVTTLFDKAILRKGKDGEEIIPPEFILGSYQILNNDKDNCINFTLNPNHMSFKNNVVSEENFYKMKKDAFNFMTLYDLFPGHNIKSEDFFKEITRSSIREKLSKEPFSIIPNWKQQEYAIVLETLDQYFNEPYLEKLSEYKNAETKDLINKILDNPDANFDQQIESDSNIKQDVPVEENEEDLEKILEENELKFRKMGIFDNDVAKEEKKFMEDYNRLRSLLIKPVYNKTTGMTDFINGNPNDSTAIEDLKKIMADEKFYQLAFKFLNRNELSIFLLGYSRYMDLKKCVIQENLNLIGEMCPSLFSSDFYKECAQNDSIMRKIVNQPGKVSPIIIHYSSKELQEDEEFKNLVKINSERKATLTSKDIVRASLDVEADKCISVNNEIRKLNDELNYKEDMNKGVSD